MASEAPESLDLIHCNTMTQFPPSYINILPPQSEIRKLIMVTKINTSTTSTNHQNSSLKKHHHSKTAIIFCIFILTFFVTQCSNSNRSNSNPELDNKLAMECSANNIKSCERLCDRGSGTACWYAGRDHVETPSFVEKWFTGYDRVVLRYKQARPFLQKSCELNDYMGCRALVELDDFTLEYMTNKINSAFKYKRSAEYHSVMNNIELMYHSYYNACLKNDVFACDMTAFAYGNEHIKSILPYKGEGNELYRYRKELFKKNCDFNNPKSPKSGVACFKLGLYGDMNYLKVGCDLNSADACSDAGFHAESREEEIKYFKKACDLDPLMRGACQEVARLTQEQNNTPAASPSVNTATAPTETLAPKPIPAPEAASAQKPTPTSETASAPTPNAAPEKPSSAPSPSLEDEDDEEEIIDESDEQEDSISTAQKYGVKYIREITYKGKSTPSWIILQDTKGRPCAIVTSSKYSILESKHYCIPFSGDDKDLKDSFAGNSVAEIDFPDHKKCKKVKTISDNDYCNEFYKAFGDMAKREQFFSVTDICKNDPYVDSEFQDHICEYLNLEDDLD